jgi:hypothetical protein
MRLLTLVLLASALPVLGREPTQQDYDIWAATLEGAHVGHGEQGITYVWHRIEPPSVFARGSEKGALERHPEFRPVVSAWSEEAIELDIERLKAALDKANDPHRFPRQLLAERHAEIARVKLLDDETLEKIIDRKPKPAWIVSPRLFKGVDTIIRLSWPAVREDGRAAYLICGEFTMWKGSICENVINKQPDGWWSAGEKSMRDILLWGGWPVDHDSRLFIDD